MSELRGWSIYAWVLFFDYLSQTRLSLAAKHVAAQLVLPAETRDRKTDKLEEQERSICQHCMTIHHALQR